MKHGKFTLRTIAALLCIVPLLILPLLLSACGKEPNRLFENASPANGIMVLYTFAEEGSKAGSYAFLSDNPREEEILRQLTAASAKEAPDWSPADVTFPIYGLEIASTDGLELHAAWSNGYLIMRDGTAYRFDFDFAKLKKQYDWEERDEISLLGLPCARHLMQNGEQWERRLLPQADTSDKATPEGISMSVETWTEEAITVKLRNQTAVEWCYGTYFSLQVCLDGIWYDIPATDEQNWAFEDIGLILGAGEEASRTYSLDMYGDLPAGDYRLVVYGLTAEGVVS